MPGRLNAKTEQYAVLEQPGISGFKKQSVNRNYLLLSGKFIPNRNSAFK